jgi:hypothetical protein
VICASKGKPMSNCRCRVAWGAGLGCFLILAPACVQSDRPHGATDAAQAKGDVETADVPIPAFNDAGHGGLDVKRPESDAGSGGAEASQPGLDGYPVEQPEAGSGVADGGAGTDDAADAGVFKPLVPGPTTWTGYVDDSDNPDFEFPSGSNAIRLTLAVDAYGQVTGMVWLGNGPPPPPATDPDVGYPPEPWVRSNQYGELSNYWAEGFGYSMTNGTLSRDRLQFSIDNQELWSGWCALQPTAWANDGGSFLPNWDSTSTILANGQPYCYQTNPANNQVVVRDCGKLALWSSGVCTCSTSSCDYEPSSSDSMAIFDLALSNGAAAGSLQGLFMNEPIAKVYFTQDP